MAVSGELRSDQVLSDGARLLAAALEPVAGQVYFSPECHANYAQLGFAGSRARSVRSRFPTGPRTSRRADR